MSQRGWRTPGERGPLNQLSREYVGSERLKRQAQALQGSAPGPQWPFSTQHSNVLSELFSLFRPEVVGELQRWQNLFFFKIYNPLLALSPVASSK